LETTKFDECSGQKYLFLLLQIDSYESGRLNRQINHMFQPKTAAPSFTSPVFISHNLYRIIHIGWVISHSSWPSLHGGAVIRQLIPRPLGQGTTGLASWHPREGFPNSSKEMNSLQRGTPMTNSQK